MNNVLIEYRTICTATELYIESIKKLKEYVDCEYRFSLSSSVSSNDINWADVLISCRPTGYDSYINAKNAKKANLFYAVYYDDDLLNWEECSPDDKKYAVECIKMADIVLSSSPLIGEEYAKLTKNHRYYIDNTALNLDEIIKVKKNDDIIHFVFAAGQSHEESFLRYIYPILDVFLDKHQNTDITFVGVSPTMNDLKNKDRVNYIKGMNLIDYNRYMSTHHFDVGFSPLIDTPFNNRKYFNKYFEYAKVGICGIYSNIKPYTYIIKDHQNGLLVDDNPTSWLKAMEELCDDALRNEIIDNSQKQLKNEFVFEKLIKKSKESNPELYNKRDNKISISFKRNKLLSLYFEKKRIIWLSLLVLRKLGMKEFIKRFRNHI